VAKAKGGAGEGVEVRVLIYRERRRWGTPATLPVVEGWGWGTGSR
jgi:hypothetical protein